MEYYATSGEIHNVTRGVVSGIEKELEIRISEDFKDFLCDLYTEATAGMLINWFTCNENINKQKLFDYISLIHRTSLSTVLKEAKK